MNRILDFVFEHALVFIVLAFLAVIALVFFVIHLIFPGFNATSIFDFLFPIARGGFLISMSIITLYTPILYYLYIKTGRTDHVATRIIMGDIAVIIDNVASISAIVMCFTFHSLPFLVSYVVVLSFSIFLKRKSSIKKVIDQGQATDTSEPNTKKMPTLKNLLKCELGMVAGIALLQLPFIIHLALQ